MYTEIGIVLLLTVINGLLAMSELAIVSARTTRLKVMADRGNKGARTAIRLAEHPGKFLSSVQIGITLVGVLSGAFSGATLGARLVDTLLTAGVPASVAQPLGVGGVVVAITYLSLIVGELVPKQIALRAPEAVASRVAPLMLFISRATAPLVWLLDTSGKLVLRLLSQSGAVAANVTDEEVRLIISEAETSGAMKPEESQMIAGVMRIADRTARGLMTPRNEVEIVDLAQSRRDIRATFVKSRRSRLPVRQGGADDIIGVLAMRDVMAANFLRDTFDLHSVIQQAPVVRDGMGALDVIERLRGSPAHMVLVYDEYGHFEGLITPMDLLEAITGEFSDDETDEPKVVTRADGSLLVAGWMPADEFADLLSITLHSDGSYETVAGLVLDTLGHLPAVGQRLEISGWTIEVIDLDGRRIDKLLVSRPEA